MFGAQGHELVASFPRLVSKIMLTLEPRPALNVLREYLDPSEVDNILANHRPKPLEYTEKAVILKKNGVQISRRFASLSLES